MILFFQSSSNNIITTSTKENLPEKEIEKLIWLFGEARIISAEKIDLVDFSPRQVIGTSAAVIPFLQNDDASRALMGTHMQCQAVPLVKVSAPIVKTGIEKKISSALHRTIYAEEDGIIEYVDGEKIILKGKSGKKQEYKLKRFIKTNKDVTFDQRPKVQ